MANLKVGTGLTFDGGTGNVAASGIVTAVGSGNIGTTMTDTRFKSSAAAQQNSSHPGSGSLQTVTTSFDRISQSITNPSVLSDTGKTFQRISSPMLKKFLNLQASMTGQLAGASYKTYYNSKVRVGETIKNPKQYAKGYGDFVEKVLQKQVDKLKTPKGKAKYENIQKEYTREIKKHVRNLEQVVKFQNLLIDAKMQIVEKLNSVKQLTNTFIKTKNGFKVTNPEGYVAIDRVSGNAVKLVDRMEFSFNNFTAIKTWDK